MKGKKGALKLALYFIIGISLGILVVWLGENAYTYILANDVVISNGSTALVYGLLIVVTLLLVCALVILKRLFSLSKQTHIGEQEDEAEVKKYKSMADYTLLLTLAIFLSFIPVSISYINFINQGQLTLLIISIILFLISMIGIITNVKVAQLLDPDRVYPKITEAASDKVILNMMDEGERYVVFQGLYIAFQMINVLFVFAIGLMLAFTLITGESQIFSIAMLVIVLMITNSSYLLTVRKQH